MSEFDSDDNCVNKNTTDNISNEIQTSHMNGTDTVYITDNTSVDNIDNADNEEYLIIDENV